MLYFAMANNWIFFSQFLFGDAHKVYLAFVIFGESMHFAIIGRTMLAGIAKRPCPSFAGQTFLYLLHSFVLPTFFDLLLCYNF